MKAKPRRPRTVAVPRARVAKPARSSASRRKTATVAVPTGTAPSAASVVFEKLSARGILSFGRDGIDVELGPLLARRAVAQGRDRRHALVKVRIYVEGGGQTSWDECRLGFAELLRKAVPDGPRPKIIPCGPRERAFEDFCTALREHGDDLVLLLVDAEAPVRANGRPWAHLQQVDHWSKPRAATDDSARLMVQMMAAWFLADPAALQRFYGAAKAEPERTNVETVSKRDVMAALDRVTRGSRRGPYHKTRHGFALLAAIDPAKLRQRATHFDRLCRRLATAG